MAKKKKQKTAKRSSAADSSKKQNAPLNAPFKGLKQALREASLPDASVKPAPVPSQEQTEPLDDGQTFLQAMSDVEPLGDKVRARVANRPETKQPFLSQEVDEDLEVMAQLADLISGNAEMDLRYSDEFVWGAAPGIGPDLMDRLAAGAFPVQDYLDLHGSTQEEALKQVEAFLIRSVTQGLRHVLIVHGRGSGSPGGIPVLKRALTQALSHKRLRKRVLAFCTALQRDGGIGAIYVLLRKWQGPGRWS
jgi:DNA-nicking Smr family endonuclease